MPNLQVTDIKEGAMFKIIGGTVFIVDGIEKDETFGDLVRTSFIGGKKGDYRDSVAEFLEFLNSKEATIFND